MCLRLIGVYQDLQQLFSTRIEAPFVGYTKKKQRRSDPVNNSRLSNSDVVDALGNGDMMGVTAQRRFTEYECFSPNSNKSFTLENDALAAKRLSSETDDIHDDIFNSLNSLKDLRCKLQNIFNQQDDEGRIFVDAVSSFLQNPNDVANFISQMKKLLDEKEVQDNYWAAFCLWRVILVLRIIFKK